MAEIHEYRIVCPNCKTEISLVAEEQNPIIFECRGCDYNIIIENSTVYTVSRDFFNNVLSTSKVVSCGQIIGYKPIKPTHKKESITEKQISDLKESLKKYTNVEDFIKNI